MSAWVFTYRHFRAPRVGLLISKMTASWVVEKGSAAWNYWDSWHTLCRHSMQFPQKDLRFAPLRLVQFYDISSMHTLGLVRVTVPTWPIQKSLKSLKVRVFGDPGLRMFAWHVYKKRTNLSASSSHDLFNILQCPFEGHHKTSNGSIKEGHFEEAEESSRSHPIWPTLPSRGEWYELQLNPTIIIVMHFNPVFNEGSYVVDGADEKFY